jgi:hypothetical protein
MHSWQFLRFSRDIRKIFLLKRGRAYLLRGRPFESRIHERANAEDQWCLQFSTRSDRACDVQFSSDEENIKDDTNVILYVYT